MGFKIKAGLALGGVLLSWGFGLNFLSGIASHVDTTGNILVDIADGIGLVSKGIEALENYLDPSSAAAADVETVATESIDASVEPDKSTSSSSSSSSSTTSSSSSSPAESASTGLAPPPPQPVICKRGKCQPYDPAKDRVLQQQLIKAERERILSQVRSGELPPGTILPNPNRIRFDEDDFEEEEEDDEDGRVRIKRIKLPKQDSNNLLNKPRDSTPPLSTPPPSPSSSSSTTPPTSTKDPDILDPNDPSVEPDKMEGSGWKFGAKRILNKTAGMFKKLSTLLLKIVKTVFPWNRRARRRLSDGEDEEE